MTQFCVLLGRGLCQDQLSRHVIADNGVGRLQRANTHRETWAVQGLHVAASILVFLLEQSAHV